MPRTMFDWLRDIEHAIDHANTTDNEKGNRMASYDVTFVDNYGRNPQTVEAIPVVDWPRETDTDVSLREWVRLAPEQYWNYGNHERGVQLMMRRSDYYTVGSRYGDYNASFRRWISDTVGEYFEVQYPSHDQRLEWLRLRDEQYGDARDHDDWGHLSTRRGMRDIEPDVAELLGVTTSDTDCHCSGCYQVPQLINSWSYTPEFVFHGDDPHGLHLGMELELEVDGRPDDAAVTALRYLMPSNIGYLKYDSTIDNGFELVTMPCAYEYHRTQFPYAAMLTDLEDMHGAYSRAGTGIHVHASRSGFSGDTHVYRWLKFVYRNERPFARIARRSNSNWAHFDPRERANAKAYAKREEPRWYPERYAAVNTLPSETFEVRIFRATTDPTEVLAALGLVAGSIEYTRTLTAHDIITKHGWTFGAFATWLRTQDDLYEPLLSQIT